MDDRRRGYVFVMLAAVFWGTSFPATKFIVGDVDPLFITTVRLGIGALVGLVVLALLHRLHRAYVREPLVWLLGLLNALALELQNVGLAFTTASKTALLANVNVVVVPILMALLFRERVGRIKIAGILVGLFGVFVLATRLNPASLAGGEFLGDALVFGSSVVWSFYIVGTKKVVDRGVDYIALTTTVLGTTAVFSAVPLLFVSGGYPPDTVSWSVLVYLGLVPTFLPMFLYVLSLRTISPTVSGLLVLLEIVVAAVLATFFLREMLDAFTLLGGALILLGIYVVTRGEREQPEPGAGGPASVSQETRNPDVDGITRR